MKNYSVAILTKTGNKGMETDTLTMVKVLARDKASVLREAFKSDSIHNLLSKGHRFISHVYDEI